MTHRIWIDTDPAITSGNGEVDDGYALLQALWSPEFEIAGISSVFGNTDLYNTYPMTKNLVMRAGRAEVPVYRGHGAEGLRTSAPAIDALQEALEQGPLTIFALGPLTNVAAALTMENVNLSNVEEVVFVGGRRVGLEFRATPQQAEPFRDLNFELDPHAAADLLKLNIPITLAGWEVSSKMWLSEKDLQKLRTDGNETARWLADASQAWHDSWTQSFQAPGFTPFDTLAIGWKLVPELFDALKCPAEVIFTPKRPLFHVDRSIKGPTVTYLKSVNNERFRDDLMARLLSPL